MPDDVIRLVLPASPEFVHVASVAVRAVARQVALPESEIDRLRGAVVAALEERVATTDGDDVSIELHPSPGSLRVELDGELLD
jgi:anti-sigma regulatory factor (Ser/Thr protein kinase)